MNRLLFCLLLAATGLKGQTTATNFNVNDCAGNPHDLFAELDQGKVAVIVWVMPCVTCIAPALAAQSEYKALIAENPGKILFYVADDYANTSCATLSGWCATNGITEGSRFSSKDIDMYDYGSPGMPKVVVAGGSGHKVYYNANAPQISGAGVRDAIKAALADITSTVNVAGFPNNFEGPGGFSLFPNPASSQVTVSGLNGTVIEIVIRDVTGKTVRRVGREITLSGTAVIGLDGLKPGVYSVETPGGRVRASRLVVMND